jgi:hypothetical protein
MTLLEELKRRNVIRVGIAYVVTSWLVIQVVETLFPVFEFSNQSIRVVVIVLAIGLVPTLLFAWAFELTSEGLKREKDVDRGALVPRPRLNLTRFHGIFAPNSRHRHKIVPRRPRGKVDSDRLHRRATFDRNHPGACTGP